MKKRHSVRADLVAFIYGELGQKERQRVEKHLEICVSCRNEARELDLLRRECGSELPDLLPTMSSIDWESLPQKIADKVYDKEQEPLRQQKKRFVFRLPKWRPVYAGILFGMILGSLATILFLRFPETGGMKNAEIILTSDFFEKAELEVARRETLDYLEKSQYLLLDFVQFSPGSTSQFWGDEQTLQRTRQLLSKKRFIDPQLDKFRMAKAKQICDQIEYLFYELMEMSEDLSPEDLKRIQDLIQQRQLLLKIKLVKKELKNSEV